MKIIALTALAALATLAPLEAAKIKFVVKNVTIVSVTGKKPPSAPSFKKGQTIELDITQKRLKGPKGLKMPIQSKSATSDVYFQTYENQALTYNTATVRKNAKSKKPINVDLTCFGPVLVFGNVTSPGQVSYTLVRK